MLSMNSSTSWFFSSRKYSVMASPDSATRRRAPGGSFIWPYTSAIFDAPRFVLLDDARFGHFVVKIVAFAGAFADAGEHRHTAVQFGDVVDQFHDDDGLADAGAAERADLAALQEGTDQIDDLDAGGEHLRGGGLIHERRRRAMDGIIFVRLDRPAFVHRVAGHVEHAAHDAFADGHGDGRAGIDDFVAALEAFGAGHGDGADPVVAEVLLHFERQLGWPGPGRCNSTVNAL